MEDVSPHAQDHNATPAPADTPGWVLEAGTVGTLEGGPGGQAEGNDRALAQAIQDDEETDATAMEWISFFQEHAQSQ
eukprot:10232703-Heterocapsa_arctica.AAC.1